MSNAAKAGAASVVVASGLGVSATACGLIWAGIPLSGVSLVATSAALFAAAAVPPLRRCAVQGGGIALVVSYRWLTGALMFRSAKPVVRLRRLERVRWAQWPRWQRAVVRGVVTGLALGAWLAPVVTALIVAMVLLSFAATVGVHRHRLAVGSRPIRVKVVVGGPAERAIDGEQTPSEQRWSSYQTADAR